MLSEMNGVSKAVSKHPLATTGSIATLTAVAGLAYVMWDKNRRAADDTADQEFSEHYGDDTYDATSMENNDLSTSSESDQKKSSKMASIWVGVGFAVSAVLGAAVYYRYATKPSGVASWLPSAKHMAASHLYNKSNRLNSLKKGATSAYDSLVKKAANIR